MPLPRRFHDPDQSGTTTAPNPDQHGNRRALDQGGTPMRNSPNRIVATVFGAVYVLVGLLGFAVTSGVGFIATEGGLLLGVFEVNPLHNVAHILIGAALLFAGFVSVVASKAVNATVGAVYLLLGIVGFFLVGTAANILALNTPDHFLHLASAIVLLGVALGFERAGRMATA
jgi:hypothetical protein